MSPKDPGSESETTIPEDASSSQKELAMPSTLMEEAKLNRSRSESRPHNEASRGRESHGSASLRIDLRIVSDNLTAVNYGGIMI